VPRPAPLVFLLLSAALVAGCGGGDATAKLDLGGPDADGVAKAVDDFNEGKHDHRRAKRAFAASALPSDWKKYDRYDFSVGERVTVSGGEATAKVNCRSEAGQTVTREWAFVKEGDVWKIKTAPLP
jgi:hypothetical protein